MPEEDNRRITEEALAAINAHDPDRYLNYLEDSHIWENDGFPAPIQSREGAGQAPNARISGALFSSRRQP